MDAALQHVEQTCALLQSDPMGAGQTLLELRNNPEAMGIARHVLEHSNMPAAHFHSAAILQAALLGRWTELPLNERAAARNYLATLLLAHGDRYASFVTSQLLQTFAVLWKRGWAEEGNEGKTQFFHDCQALSQQPDKVILATKYLLALVGEFSTAKSAALGLPLEFHRQAHKAFETYGLLPCLELGIGMMSQLLKEVLAATAPGGGVGNKDPAEASLLMCRLEATVKLCVEILSWDFGGFDPLHEPSTTAPSFISPPITWRPYLLKMDLLEALMEVYVRVRKFPEQEERAHALRQLLTQLASLQGPVFPTGQERAQYAAFLVRGSVELLSESMNCAMETLKRGDEPGTVFYGKETVALSSLLQVCVSNFRLPVLATFPFFPDFCQRLSAVACQLLATTAGLALNFRGSNSDWSEECEHGWTMDAFDLLLETWITLIEDPALGLLCSMEGGGSGGNSPPFGPLSVPAAGGMEGGGNHHGGLDGSLGGSIGSSSKGGGNSPRDFDLQTTRRVVVEAGGPMYQAYQSCRVTLSQIEAARSVAEEEDEDEGVIAEMGTHEQMTYMANVGRLAPPSSLLFLKHLLLDPPGTEANGRKGGCFPRLHLLMTAGGIGGGGGGGAAGATAAAAGVDRSPSGVAALMEEVRVLVQGLGHLMADDFTGEQPAIPEAIHRLCFQMSGSSPTELIVETAGQVHLLAKFLLQRVMEAPHDPLLSPYLTEAVLWFLTRFARTYLMPDPKLYRNGIIAPSILAAFSGEAGAAQVDGLLQLAWGFLTRWPSQSELAEGAIGLLRALLSGASMGLTTLRLDSWRVMLAALEAETRMINGGAGVANGHHQQHHPPPSIPPELGYMRLSPDVRGELLEVLVGGILSRENDPEAPRALMQVATPLEARLQQLLVKLSGSKSVGQGVARQVEDVAGLYAGLARAVDNSGQSLLAQLLTRALEPLLQAATQCQAYPETMHAVLGFLRDYAEVHISSLGADATMALLTSSGLALKAYAAQNIGRKRADANSKEEAISDILCVLELLSHLATKDFIDFSAEHEGRVAADTVADVVFYGLERMIPLMTEEYLDFPPLSKQYFTLVNSMVSTYTARVALLAHPLFMQLVQSVMFGVQRPDSEIARDSLRALAGLVSFHAKAQQQQGVGVGVGGGGGGLSTHVQAQPQLLSDCMHKLLHMVVYEGSIWDRLDAASNAILALVLCDREAFVRMVNGILEQQPPTVKERLRAEFEELTTAIPPPQAVRGGGTDRHTRLAFRDKLKRFAQRVRPFMQMR